MQNRLLDSTIDLEHTHTETNTHLYQSLLHTCLVLLPPAPCRPSLQAPPKARAPRGSSDVNASNLRERAKRSAAQAFQGAGLVRVREQGCARGGGCGPGGKNRGGGGRVYLCHLPVCPALLPQVGELWWRHLSSYLGEKKKFQDIKYDIPIKITCNLIPNHSNRPQTKKYPDR